MKQRIIGATLAMAMVMSAITIGAATASAATALDDFKLTATMNRTAGTYNDKYEFMATTSIADATVSLLWDGHTSSTPMDKKDKKDNRTHTYSKTAPDPGNRTVKITASKSGFKTQTVTLSFTVKATLDTLVAGSGVLGNFKANTKWGNHMSASYGIQCKGFATAVFDKLYGHNIGPYPSSARHTISINSSKTSVVFSMMRPDKATLASKFQSAKSGDFIQMSKSTSQHSMIVYSVSSSGVTVYDANSDGANTIKKQVRDWTYFYDYMGSSSYGISVYRSK